MIQNPFQPGGIPDQTYVKVALSGALKKALGFNKIKYVYGPSKVGKTTVLSKVFIEENLNMKKVVCSEEKTADEIESEIFTFKKISTGEKLTGEALMGGSIGIPIAKLNTTIKGMIENSKNEEQSIKIQSALYFWIDDFHLLNLIERNRLSARLKRLSEEGVNIVVVGVDHTRGELLKKVADLGGRIEFIKADGWNNEDLLEIINSGFKSHLNSTQINLIADLVLKQSFKNPQIVQDLCAFVFSELFNDNTKKDTSDSALQNLVKQGFERLEQNALDGSHSSIVRLFRGPDSRGTPRIEIEFEGFKGDSYSVLFNRVAKSDTLTIQLDKHVIGVSNAKISNFLIRAGAQWIEQGNKSEPIQQYFYYDEETKELHILDPYTILAMRGYLCEIGSSNNQTQNTH